MGFLLLAYILIVLVRILNDSELISIIIFL